MSLVARVVPDVTGVDKVFDYLIPSELQDVIGVGDRVRVMETRPMSKLKRWRIVEILERAK